jgi:tetratricopeptide (TPR) repeat protein
LRVVDLALDTPPLRAQNAATASDVARRYEAGTYLTTSITGFGDSVEVTTALWNTAMTAAPVAERTIRLPNDSVNADGPWRRLVATLLAADSGSTAGDSVISGTPGTSSVVAWRAYARGQAARLQWDLARAEEHFRAAVAADPRFAQAQLWLAQVGAWARPDRPESWRDAGARALDLARNLTRQDSLLALGVAALGASDFPTSCTAYRRLRDLQPNDPTSWLGIGQCEAVDGLVLRDPKSPSGWRFRTSWRSAAAAYDSALRRADGAPIVAFQWLSRVLLVDPAWSRDGYGADRTIFRAYPTLLNDTLAHVPYPSAEFEAGAARADRSTVASALKQNARHIQLAYIDWTGRAPKSADAWEALSFIQEVTGERAAEEGGGLIALRSNLVARSLTTDAGQRLRLLQAAIRLHAKTEAFASANALADSVLRAIPRADGSQAVWLAGIAALVGRVERTTELLRAKARVRPTEVFWGPAPPPMISDAAAAYQAIAAAGVCGEPLRQAHSDVDQAVDHYTTADARISVRQLATSRAASLSVPCLGIHAVDSVVSRDPLVAMQKAVAANDVNRFRTLMASLNRARQHSRPGDIAIDHIYQEAWLLAATGDTAGAIGRLDLSLTALTTLNTHLLEDIPSAAALGRAMTLRADLAASRGDRRTAQRWASNVLALWAGASAALGTELVRMKGYASNQH